MNFMGHPMLTGYLFWQSPTSNKFIKQRIYIMETDLMSVVIGLASIATFLVPIGYYQMKEKAGVKKAKKQFLYAAMEHGFQPGEYDVLRNRAVIGIGRNGEELLYVHDAVFELVEICDLNQATLYKKTQSVSGENGEQQKNQVLGLQLKMKKGGHIRLPVFEGRDGTQAGDERIIIQGWIRKIESAKKELDQHSA
jgi:hypothetical protein